MRTKTRAENKKATPKGRCFCGAGIDLSSREVTLQVFSAPLSLTSVFGMGTGGTSASYTPAIRLAARLRRSAASRRRSLKGLASPLDPGLCRLATTRSSKPSDRILNKVCLRHDHCSAPRPRIAPPFGTALSQAPMRFRSFGDPCGNRTRVTGVRGRCLNRLTNGPNRRPGANLWCAIRDSNPGPAD